MSGISELEKFLKGKYSLDSQSKKDGGRFEVLNKNIHFKIALNNNFISKEYILDKANKIRPWFAVILLRPPVDHELDRFVLLLGDKKTIDLAIKCFKTWENMQAIGRSHIEFFCQHVDQLEKFLNGSTPQDNKTLLENAFGNRKLIESSQSVSLVAS